MARKTLFQIVVVLILAACTLGATVNVARTATQLRMLAELDAATDAQIAHVEAGMANVDDVETLRRLVVGDMRKDATAARVHQQLGDDLRRTGIAIVALQIAAMFLLTLVAMKLRAAKA